MATTMLETLGTVRTDGTLDLDQRVTIPPGRVKVRLESTSNQEVSATLPRQSSHMDADSVTASASLDQRPSEDIRGRQGLRTSAPRSTPRDHIAARSVSVRDRGHDI